MKILPLSPGSPSREADISAPGTSFALRGKDLPDLPDPHAQRKLEPDGAGRDGGPGDDVLEPPECERIPRFQPALNHFRVGKGEDTAGVRQERALFRRGLQEDDA